MSIKNPPKGGLFYVSSINFWFFEAFFFPAPVWKRKHRPALDEEYLVKGTVISLTSYGIFCCLNGSLLSRLVIVILRRIFEEIC